MATTPEAKVKKAIRSYLTSIKAWHFNPIGGPYTTHGIPDIIGCKHGRLIAIEVKAPGRLANVTPNQQLRLREIAAAGGLAILADDVDTVKRAIVAAGLDH